MALAEFNLRQLLEAGVHFGHQTKRWNPLMSSYIYGTRNGIHILDLTQTVPLLNAALQAVTQTVAKGGIILFVGTKRQAQRPIAEAAEKSAQYYMNHRWLGGTLTNWKTVSNSISRLKNIDEQLEGNTEGLTKKERLNIEREQGKLQASLGGIREMGGIPDLVFVIDTNKESLAIQEAKKLGIPVVAILDTNSNPEGIDFPIPGNDDASRSIALYCDLVARAALDGMESQLGAAGVDLGAKAEGPIENISPGKDKKSDPESQDKLDTSFENSVLGEISDENISLPESEKDDSEESSNLASVVTKNNETVEIEGAGRIEDGQELLEKSTVRSAKQTQRSETKSSPSKNDDSSPSKKKAGAKISSKSKEKPIEKNIDDIVEVSKDKSDVAQKSEQKKSKAKGSSAADKDKQN